MTFKAPTNLFDSARFLIFSSSDCFEMIGWSDLPILVFYPQIDGLETIIDSKLEPSLYSASLLRKFHQLLKQKNKKSYPVHRGFLLVELGKEFDRSCVWLIGVAVRYEQMVRFDRAMQAVT